MNSITGFIVLLFEFVTRSKSIKSELHCWRCAPQSYVFAGWLWWCPAQSCTLLDAWGTCQNDTAFWFSLMPLCSWICVTFYWVTCDFTSKRWAVLNCLNGMLSASIADWQLRFYCVIRSRSQVLSFPLICFRCPLWHPRKYLAFLSSQTSYKAPTASFIHYVRSLPAFSCPPF